MNLLSIIKITSSACNFMHKSVNNFDCGFATLFTIQLVKATTDIVCWWTPKEEEEKKKLWLCFQMRKKIMLLKILRWSY